MIQKAAAVEDTRVMPLSRDRSATVRPTVSAPFTLPPRMSLALPALIGDSTLDADTNVRPLKSSITCA